MVCWNKRELHPSAGPPKQIDWNESLESMVEQYDIKGIRPRGFSEEIFIPLPEN